MAVISMKALLESGVHFGHRTNKWDPRMRPYIFTERNGIHIIDLQQTAKALNHAYGIIRDAAANGGTVLFVGTKRQAQETVRDEAVRCGMPYVTERWLGGMLTNWNTMRQRIEEMERLEHLRDSGEISRLTKKEGLLIQREILRLNTRLEGVRSMKRLPDLVFIVDVGREDAAVHEANILNIPVIALVDTNCDPGGVDYVIPSNDDAIRAIKLLVAKVADAVLEGQAVHKEEESELAEAASAAAPARKAVPTHAEEMKADEGELTDADLLGKSTLAKIVATAETEAVAEAPTAAETEEPAKPETVEEAALNEEEAIAEKDAGTEEAAAPETVVKAKAGKKADTAEETAPTEESPATEETAVIEETATGAAQSASKPETVAKPKAKKKKASEEPETPAE
jgi:small subunit ribosomal protein S2